MLTPPGVIVACSISDATARRLAVGAIEREGFVARELTPGPSLWKQLNPFPRPSALIHDLAPWDQSAVDALRAVRAALPALPILIWPPALPNIGSLLLECGRLSLISAELYRGDGYQGLRLAKQLHESLRQLPATIVPHLILNILPGLPRCVVEFCRQAAKRLSDRAPLETLTVRVLAATLGKNPRHLERLCRHARLPSPKELIDWSAMIFVTYAAALTGTRSCKVARDLGFDSQHLYRLRRRLLVGSEGIINDNRQEFEIALLAFAERCSAARDHGAMVRKRASA